MRRAVLVPALALGLAIAPAAALGSVRVTSVTSPASAGSYATLSARVAPTATCSITVQYKSGSSRAQGLYRKRAVAGRVAWTWKVGTRTTPGTWPIFLACGQAGTAATSFRVS